MKTVFILAALAVGGYLLYCKMQKSGFDYGARRADTRIQLYGG